MISTHSTTTLEIQIRCILFENKENGYNVVSAWTRNEPRVITVKGILPSSYCGQELIVTGKWEMNEKYKEEQFNVDSYEIIKPSTALGLKRFFRAAKVKGLGDKTAEMLFNTFGENTLDILETDINKISEVKGISSIKAQALLECWKEQNLLREVMIFLTNWGLPYGITLKLYQSYGLQAISKVKENPYCLTEERIGVTFTTIDKIALNNGYSQIDNNRIKACIKSILKARADAGDCYLTKEEIIEYAINVLNVPKLLISGNIENLCSHNEVVRHNQCIYLHSIYYAECGVAKSIKRILRNIDNEKIIVVPNFEELEAQGLIYNDQQKRAIHYACTENISIITGGPGTGKTTTINGIINAYKKSQLKIALAAPTGRASKRMAESTKMPAKTIHRLLEFNPFEKRFMRDIDNPLDCDLLIVDECSMIDVVLMNRMLSAIKPGATVVLLGDVDQLPSIGPGNVLKEMIESRVLPVVKLEEIYRQAKNSNIIINSQHIRKGEDIEFDNSTSSDFFSKKIDSEEIALTELINLYTTKLPAYYNANAINDIQIICPMKKGLLGTENLNQILQSRLNPNIEEIEYKNTKFKLGDKVMQKVNNYTKMVFNGDTGLIVDLDIEEQIIVVKYDERNVEYSINEFEELVLAYAITVHKSQGSEYPIVIMPIVNSHKRLLERNLLYTGVTRPRKALILLYEDKAIEYAINNQLQVKRNSGLKYLLSDCEIFIGNISNLINIVN